MVNGPPAQPKPGQFKVPGAAVARHPAVMLAPREVRQWLGGLPLANPPRAAQLLLQQLRLVVRDPQPGSRLGTLLQLYQGPIDQLLEIVNERLQVNSDSALPLDQLEYSLLDLLSELAFGHLRMANATLDSDKPAAAETLYQAMRLLENAMNIERLHYFRLAPDLWQLLLNIYLYADGQQTAGQMIDVAQRRPDDPGTIQGLFFRALTISLCDPHQHRPEQIRNWQRWTGWHTAALETTVLPQGPFAVPLDISGVLPPLAAARRGKPGPDMRYLALDRFLQALRDDPGAPSGLHQALTDLIKGRKSSEQRQHPRQVRNHPFQLMHGLRDVHARLDALVQGVPNRGLAAEAIPCRQLNQSKSGAAFRLQGPLNPPLTVGESVLLEADAVSPSGAAVGFAGRIRRLVGSGDQQIEIGVEKLSGRLIPVTVTGNAAERARGQPEALLQQDLAAGRYVLIAPRTLYREGDSLIAEGSQRRHELRMQELLEVVQQTAYIAVEDHDA